MLEYKKEDTGKEKGGQRKQVTKIKLGKKSKTGAYTRANTQF